MRAGKKTEGHRINEKKIRKNVQKKVGGDKREKECSRQ